ncbi:MAG TPA: metallophosphoesterase [Chitinophagaceae bacterium]|nr:metallophosphoesterase [Chitinophagaceae bacterium]
MIRRFAQRLLRGPITRLAQRLSSAPRKEAVFKSLSSLLERIIKKGAKNDSVIRFDLIRDRFIIFSDQHKGGRDLADDFRLAEKNYLEALRYYYENGYTLICLGDCEELWENEPKKLMEANRKALDAEAQFLHAGRYHRVFGNHDLEWKYEIQRALYLKPVFGDKLKVCEGLILQTPYNNDVYSVFLTHGHQGDQRSDGNAFSKWIVAAIWTPIQRFLEINIDTVSDSIELVDKHNIIMYQWSATQKNLVFISGHTHKPVFASLDHVERLTTQLARAKEENDTTRIAELQAELEKRKAEYAGKQFLKTMAIPSYFNTGCCCFFDGDITGIEIADGDIRLVKWEQEKEVPQRKVLEQSPLTYIFDKLTLPIQSPHEVSSAV